MTEPLGEDALVGTIEVRTVGDEFYAGWTSGDGTVGCAGDHANTPVGALAHLCSVLIKLDEDEAAPELLAALDETVTRLERCMVHAGSDPDFAHEATKDARAAIATARGAAPTPPPEGRG